MIERLPNDATLGTQTAADAQKRHATRSHAASDPAAPAANDAEEAGTRPNKSVGGALTALSDLLNSNVVQTQVDPNSVPGRLGDGATPGVALNTAASNNFGAFNFKSDTPDVAATTTVQVNVVQVTGNIFVS